MSDPDYSTWLTKQQAADAIGVTTKSVERWVQAGQIQQARWRRPTGGPELAVYQPDDVARIAAERTPGPPAPFLMPTGAALPPTNGNGHHPAALARVPSAERTLAEHLSASAPGQDLLTVLVTAAARVMSETSQKQTLFVTLQEASAVTGLSQAYLKRQIENGKLPAVRDVGWRIRRKDLEQL